MIDTTNRPDKQHFTEANQKAKKESSWISTIKYMAICAVAVFLFRTFIYQPFSMSGPYMKPSIIEKDLIFAAKYTYGYNKYSLPNFLVQWLDGTDFIEKKFFSRSPAQGDIIFAENFFQDRSSSTIGRVIAFPNDKIKIESGTIFVNGKELIKTVSREYIDRDLAEKVVESKETLPNGISYPVLDIISDKNERKTFEFTVPDGHYFVVADVRSFNIYKNFEDLSSAYIVPFKKITARLDFVLLNTKAISVIGGGAVGSLVASRLRFMRSLRKAYQQDRK